MTDLDRIEAIVDSFGVEYKRTLKAIIVGSRRYAANDDGEIVKVQFIGYRPNGDRYYQTLGEAEE